MEPGWVAVGRVVRSRGRSGEVIVEPLGSTDIRQLVGRHIRLESPQQQRTERCDAVWLHDGRPVVKFAGISSISDAEVLRGYLLCVAETDRQPLDQGEVYFDDLVGCEATEFDTQRSLGVVEDWQETGAVPLLVIRTQSGSELLVPFAHSICRTIDIEKKVIVLQLPEGLLELNES